MSIQVIPKSKQGFGAFNGGQIVENKPIGFPNDKGELKPYSNLFYWAYAEARVDSEIGLRPHQGFEIMSFVLRGQIRHYDTKLKEWRPLDQGDAQIIRAGNGISHAEFMSQGSVMFQIWFDPNLDKTLQQEASYNDYKNADFPRTEQDGISIKTYVGDGSPFQLDTSEVEIRELSFGEINSQLSLNADRVHSIYAIQGTVEIDGATVEQDGFVVVKDTDAVNITSDGATLFHISSPAEVPYPTYAEMMQARMRNN